MPLSIVGTFWERDEMLAEEIAESYARQARGEYPPEHPRDTLEREIELDVEEILAKGET